MTDTTTQMQDPGPILACTVSRDVQNFDLLIEDMEEVMGEAWGDLGFDEVLPFLSQPDGAKLEFIALAIDADDEEGNEIDRVAGIISGARDRGVKVILIAEDVTPAALHRLLRCGADEFIPYPLPRDELAAAVDRLRNPPKAVAEQAPEAAAPAGNALEKGGDGVLIGVQGMAGGCGATMLAVNLAYELATQGGDRPPRVCLMDLGLQFGSVATYLDLPRRDAVLELLSDPQSMDGDSFGQALVRFDDKMQVFTSPPDILPLDMPSADDIKRFLDIARDHFDYIVVDMPGAIAQWSEVVLLESQVFFGVIELDMRSAQNVLRFKRALLSENLPFDKIRFVLNRAPKFTDLQGKSRVRRMADSLDIALDVHLPDGGKPVAQSGDHGLPLATHAPKNPLRKEISKLARDLHALGQTDADAA